MDRRTFLAGLGAFVVLGSCADDRTPLEPGTPAGPASAGDSGLPALTMAPAKTVAPIEAPVVELEGDPFGSGVASGDPTPSSVVLWTRLLNPGLGDEVPLVWEVATTATFDVLVATELARVSRDDAHTIRAVVTGLPSAATLWYRFRVGGHTSAVGRTRTLPGPDDPADRLRLAVSSCQLFQDGHYAAHRDIAEADVDMVVWLGDFIYEQAGSSSIEGRSISGEDATTLAGYRDRYARYRSDPLLQAAQAAHPWVSTWDDHEVANDYNASVDRRRRAAAYRAWWENTPTSLPPPTDEGLRVHRSVDYGDLARLCLVDVRQHADDSTLLGAAQRAWLNGQLDSDQRWTVLATPVLFSGLVSPLGGVDPTLLRYAWAAYPDEQTEVAERLAGRNSLVVSGDLHTSMVLDVVFDPDDGDGSEVTAATELMAPAISSAFPARLEPFAPLLTDVNPQVRRIEVANGWMLVDIGPDGVTAEFRFVDDIEDPDSTMTVGRRYRIDPGNPRARQL